MFMDDEGQPFNPFSVGPSVNNKPYEYEIPSSPTYPPPVFATWPPPKELANRSISQGTLTKKEASEMKLVRSQRGEVALSKAINEEMAAAKQLAADERRIYAGREPKAHLSEARCRDNKSHDSVTTLLPVRDHRSKSSLMSQVDGVSTAASRKSVHSAVGPKMASNISVHSLASAQRMESNITLKQTKGTTDTTKSGHTEADHVSRAGAGAHQVNRYSRASLKSQTVAQQEDNVSRASVHQANKASIKSESSDLQANKTSRISIKSIDSANQADKISRISIRSQTGDNVPRTNIKKNNAVESMKRASLKELAESVKKELELSMQTTKSLAEKAALLSDRLKAGNEFKHNRFNSLDRGMYTTTEPLKRCREDRMAFWFKDAVIS
ncbi:uncharacterized protein LOC6561546 [Drosophila grimshawi]|uniref:GH11368 n=1 Tax=Drosophila grimshawi TaxID=7222 RepID=B4JEG2_DROGR|nr:uncharacterized protein LOC6561546 [Drosophila grimshawi]EDW03682.1 GH11368 [Drosophila grimshawi]